VEQSYWLERKRASAANARIAGSSEARLAHLELAGRYSIKAAVADRRIQLELPRPDRGDPGDRVALEAPPRR
jgi:hypothetical protein